MKEEFKIQLELTWFHKYFILFMCVFGIVLSIYVFFTPRDIQENPKLIYLCPILIILCVIGIFSALKLRINLSESLIKYQNVFINKEICFHEIKKLRLSNFKTLRVISDKTKIELTKDLTNQKEAIRFIINKAINEYDVEILHPEFLTEWFSEDELNDLRVKMGNASNVEL